MRPFVCLALMTALAGCGIDALLFTPRSYTPTPGPKTTITGRTFPGAAVRILGAEGRVVASGAADPEGAFSIELLEGTPTTNLRLYAAEGAKVHKGIVARLSPGDTADLGSLSARTTGVALLATFEVLDEAGSTFVATPPPALAGLMGEIGARPTPAFEALVEVLGRIEAETRGAPVLDPATAAIGEASSFAVEAREKLIAAAADYALVVRCDPSRLASMFTVDLSGRGRDGNGAPQLIRQPPKESRVFFGYTADESSPITDDTIPRRLIPNDPRSAMVDDGTQGDEVAGDGIYTVVVPLPRGARLLYKYTDGAAGEGFTGSEEWSGNARIIEVEDVLSGRPDGRPDCLVVRRDVFGDEASNKNFVNLNTIAKARGGALPYDGDLGGGEAPVIAGGVRVGGLALEGPRASNTLTPQGVPEARENGICSLCPAPLILDPDDAIAPTLLAAERTAVDRVRIRFSEPLANDDASAIDRYLYLDETGRAVPVLLAKPSGAEVLLTLEPTHPRTPARLRVKNLRDASVAANLLPAAEVEVGGDQTAPKVLSVRALSILEIDPRAVSPDPTVGDLVEVTFDERPESSAASDPVRYAIAGLDVRAAALIEGTKVRLSTGVQAKDAPYSLDLRGLRDPAGNASDQSVSFTGFGLHRVTFQVVPGFAYASSDGQSRGLPRGEKLYLSGPPLATARGVDGQDLSVSGATDVTGWPAFELVPGARSYEGQPIYELTVLLDKRSWSYKAAHGVEGDYLRTTKTRTLEKVYKTLATTNDGTGVRIDPRTMIAANGLSYSGARLSESGDEPPRSNVVYKREAPDEVCEVNQDTMCPPIVLGTWRDLVLDPGPVPRDYDDGIVTLPPHRPTLPDLTPPLLLDARARDSYSLLLSFDEAVVTPTALEVELARAEDGIGKRVTVIETSEVRPHQIYVELVATDCAGAMGLAEAYTVRYRGARNADGLRDRQWRTQTLLSPASCVAKTPLTDRQPPALASVVATDLGELVVRFDERIDPASIVASSFSVARIANGVALPVLGASVLSDKSSVLLLTETQSILEPYRLTVGGILDAADPANTLASATIDFPGFGERTPPVVLRARAVDSTHVVVRFDEAIDSASALEVSRYTIDGLTVVGASASGDPGRRNLAFNRALAPRIRDLVLLETSPMSAGQSYVLAIDGVRDLSGNSALSSVPFTGVDEPPKVDVILEYQISDGVRVAGGVPSRAISLVELSDSREGVFVLGARATQAHTPAPGKDAPVNDALGGFGVEGQELLDLEPRLVDNGAPPDLSAGDGVFAIRIPEVPLGTTIIWKAFAPYSTAYRDRVGGDGPWANADALPGPRNFADGAEYPGNENGVIVLDDGGADGVVRIRCLYGDEVTYKKGTGNAAYIWLADDQAPRP